MNITITLEVDGTFGVDVRSENTTSYFVQHEVPYDQIAALRDMCDEAMRRSAQEPMKVRLAHS
jgi:hypothetical protein